ncbi:hypothetical protein [Parabacteroides sp. Marseille-P3160]|uniref:hypothetical protein n=1 Tax=Parabacteroides sp. Marseille-P3160 TaxID=1917887 RepID=UPI0009BC3F55|nr:hypothetical protein [Parabacteroides sp. Marseille-P3160]
MENLKSLEIASTDRSVAVKMNYGNHVAAFIVPKNVAKAFITNDGIVLYGVLDPAEKSWNGSFAPLGSITINSTQVTPENMVELLDNALFASYSIVVNSVAGE